MSRLLAGQTTRVGDIVRRTDGCTEGLDDGLTVGTRVGKGVTITTHSKLAPTPPLELKPGRHLQVDDAGFETLLAGQRWHWPTLESTPRLLNASPVENVNSGQASQVKPWLPLPAEVGVNVDANTCALGTNVGPMLPPCRRRALEGALLMIAPLFDGGTDAPL